MNHPMTEKHASELKEYGEKLDVKVTIHPGCYVTFRDFEVHDFPMGVRLLRQIQETELPEQSSLVY